jgi:hypothetical protein
VVLTSDHGELLGERGLIGHNTPACPELVYVPGVFIHPALAAGTKVSDRIVSHVDLLPTVLAALGQEVPPHLDGMNLLAGCFRDVGYNGHLSRYYSATSVWDTGGGHVFLHNSRLRGLFSAVARTVTPHWSCLRYALSNPRLVSLFTRPHQVFGHPGIGEAEARLAIASAESGEKYDAPEQELPDEVIERLRALGYLD